MNIGVQFLKTAEELEITHMRILSQDWNNSFIYFRNFPHTVIDQNIKEIKDSSVITLMKARCSLLCLHLFFPVLDMYYWCTNIIESQKLLLGLFFSSLKKCLFSYQHCNIGFRCTIQWCDTSIQHQVLIVSVLLNPMTYLTFAL